MTDLRPIRWRERAEEIRVQAESMKDASARKTLLDTAKQWDAMADELERMQAKPREKAPR